MKKISEFEVKNLVLFIIVFFMLAYFVGVLALVIMKWVFIIGVGLFVILFIGLGYGINYINKERKKLFK